MSRNYSMRLTNRCSSSSSSFSPFAGPVNRWRGNAWQSPVAHNMSLSCWNSANKDYHLYPALSLFSNIHPSLTLLVHRFQTASNADTADTPKCLSSKWAGGSFSGVNSPRGTALPAPSCGARRHWPSSRRSRNGCTVIYLKTIMNTHVI